MIQPNDLKRDLPMKLSNDVLSTTTKVWEVLAASKVGDLYTVKKMVEECPELIYAQYNYTPPIHFAVREGHIDLVRFLLAHGAHDARYKIYPFQESLQVVAQDRGYNEIVALLNEYAADSSLHKFKGDNGEIFYNRTEEQKEFEKAVYEEDLEKTEEILKRYPELVNDETYFWGEGILTFAAKENNRAMIDLLTSYGAKVPDILKWTQFYYFEHDDGAACMMEKGMNANTMSWHHVTILHDMAQKGNSYKAELLLKHGADINALDEEYQSTPLGMAARWGYTAMVQYFLTQGADPGKAGAVWSTPLGWAKKRGHAEIQQILTKAGAK
ncbi:ankyrin repeat domain-containing protein [Terrimonas sp. NA20]|uniref:Ankyrin repeat domain-containing protein n=1 Tax=Terrimonas ginsenosidimutans TaxID=2908004 RepID=A0ABS9KUA4_9BACT|nr:ankyrin repeat domain-containing protein [Terrimonas ginsenosidimutans]MCG2615849.1 ankyrin repeat domain-containing protein [Terrimonas ginsenosidimutans]